MAPGPVDAVVGQPHRAARRSASRHGPGGGVVGGGGDVGGELLGGGAVVTGGVVLGGVVVVGGALLLGGGALDGGAVVGGRVVVVTVGLGVTVGHGLRRCTLHLFTNACTASGAAAGGSAALTGAGPAANTIMSRAMALMTPVPNAVGHTHGGRSRWLCRLRDRIRYRVR